MKSLFRKIVGSNYFLPGLILLLLFGAVFYPTTVKYAQSYKFVDEEEYIVDAWLMTTNLRLYHDMSTNHQPVPYITSALFQKTFETNWVFMLIQRHRQLIFVLHLLGAMLLLRRFGNNSLLIIIPIEIIKYSLLGNEFLAESLAIYPFIYLALVFFESIIKNKFRDEEFWLGLLASYLILCVLPLAIPIIFMLGYRLMRRRGSEWKKLLSGSVIPWLVVLLFVSPDEYFRDTWIYNWRYAIPRLSNISGVHDWVRLFFYPLFQLIERSGWLDWWAGLIIMVWISAFLYLLLVREWKKLYIFGIVYVMWFLTNLRVLEVGVSHFRAFHLLQWWSFGIIGAVWLPRLTNYKIHKGLWLILVLGTISLGLHPTSPLRAEVDPATESYVQYTPITQASQVINALKNPEDRLLVAPTEVLVHWLTKLPIVTKQSTYYEWQYYAPYQREAYENMLTTNPPRFIQYTFDGSPYTDSLERLLNSRYVKLFVQPDVFIRLDTLSDVNGDQWNMYAQLPFDVTPIEDLRHRIQ